MDHILETIRTATDNDQRKAAAAQLRQIQEQQPNQFLEYTWSGISSSSVSADIRFFLTTTVLSFVEESWHNAVDKELQKQVLSRYIELVLREPFPTVLLARKVGMIVALMAKRGAGRSQGDELPPLVRMVTCAYNEALRQCCSEGEQGLARLPQLLLMTHMFLKCIQTKRVGRVFERACAELVQSTSAVFTMLSPLDPLTHYDAYLYLFKCSLRVFGCGVFEPSLYTYLLSATWQLASRLDPNEAPAPRAKRVRLLEYAVKIQEKMVTYFPSQLSTLPQAFFVGSGGADDNSLFRLVCAIVETHARDGSSNSFDSVLSEKCMCRAMRLLCGMFVAEDGDEFVGQCIATLCQSEMLQPLMRNLICGFLPDDTSSAAAAEWADQPEKVAGDFDVDMDDEYSAVSCAEQLFLAMTGSTMGASFSLAAAWAVVNELLAAGSDERNITAALHAIGIGYFTMADSENPQSYLQFLQQNLLPILQASQSPNSADHPTLFVLRRVVWLVGMWCESVIAPEMRRGVHVALEGMLQHQTNIVIVLTTLRAIQNFISDNNFTPSELTDTSAQTILCTIQQALPHLRSPTSVNEAASVVYLLIEKKVITAHGDFILAVFLPAVGTFLNLAATGGTSADDDDDDNLNMSSLTTLLECLSSAVRVCCDDTAIWALLHPVVIACTRPGDTVTPWAEDSAWELLLDMARSSQTFHLPSAQEALQWTEQNRSRDFAVLHIVVRAQATLLMLRQQAPEDLYHPDRVKEIVTALVGSHSPELQTSYFFLLLVIARLSSGPLRHCIMENCVGHLSACPDVQAVQWTLPVAVLTAAILKWAQPGETAVAAFESAVASCASLPEQFVLLLDVSPSDLATRLIAATLHHVQCRVPVAPDNAQMIRTAMEGVAAALQPTTGGQDDEAEVRTNGEMLLELVGDEDVQNPGCLYAQRLFGMFDSIMNVS